MWQENKVLLQWILFSHYKIRFFNKKETSTLGEFKLTFQVILGYFYGPALVIWNHCSDKQGTVIHPQGMLGEKDRLQDWVIGSVYNYGHFMPQTMVFWAFSVQNAPKMGSAKAFVGMGRIWTICTQLFLQPPVVPREQIEPTCHSLVPAGIVGCDGVGGLWRAAGASLVDSFDPELVCLSLSQAQHWAPAALHRLGTALHPLLWASHTPARKHSPQASFALSPPGNEVS